MKKIFLLLVVPLVFMTTLSAQTSQQQADQIVQQRLEGETKPHCIYAKEEVQTGFEITSVIGEALELDYLAWVYYVSYTGETNGKYLVVKESNGNLLEINSKNDDGPNDLENWRMIDDYPIEIPFTEYSLSETSCQWINLNYDETVIIINSAEELASYISCTEGTYPEIDFSQYTLLLANGETSNGIFYIAKNIQQLSCSEYELQIKISLYEATVVEEWVVALIVKKMGEESSVELHVTYTETHHYLTITPDKTWNIEVGMACLEGFCYLGITTIKTGDIRTFNGKEYYELLRTADPFQQEEEIITYVREKNGQVFFYVEDCDMEYLMYDYNLNIGDEVYLADPRYPYSFFNQDDPCELTEDEWNYFYRCKITDLDVIMYDQVARKRIRTDHYYSPRHDYWVEGIGAMRGITYQGASQIAGTVHQLKDCYEADEMIFENENPEYIWAK